MNWTIPLDSGQSVTLVLENGGLVFLVGANGSGKSALIQHFVTSNAGRPIRRISAHRKAWFVSGSIDLTPQSRRRFETATKGYEAQYESRWKDDYEDGRQSAVLFDLVARENSRARQIARYVDSKRTKQAETVSEQTLSPFVQINDLLNLGNLSVTIENANDEEILARHHDGSATYSFAQMSDGERNAAIIAANVLTVEPGTFVLIDEPERHLHRSIIEPFLSALFKQRSDCCFVISTHEVALPSNFTQASVLIVRSCRWKDNVTTAWDIDVLASAEELPEDLRCVILGARRRVLFVEGSAGSLDAQLYETLFPDLSVIPKEGCAEVMKAVSGLRGSSHHHHVEAFGLVDRDDRPDSEVDKLSQAGVFALDVCSVESLYYCSDSIQAVAHRQAESLGRCARRMMELATRRAFACLTQSELDERMAARRCERQVRTAVQSHLPSWKDIRASGNKDVRVCVPSPYAKEVDHFRSLVKDKDLDRIVARYPLRESGVFGAIATALELPNRKDRTYEATLLGRVRDDEELSKKLRQRVGVLSEALGSR